MVDIDEYTREETCEYKGELYSVRDNGAIMRHARTGKKVRPLDNNWTFGNKDYNSGYMLMNSHRVHIIVATAYYGARDSKTYVVDHIDTNRCNNRAENLRWFTKLENALNNDITRHKIIYLCGSIEAFLDNPRILDKYTSHEKSFEWMRTVSKEEADNCRKHLEEWANKDKTDFITSNNIENNSSKDGKLPGEISFDELKDELRQRDPISVAEYETKKNGFGEWLYSKPSDYPALQSILGEDNTSSVSSIRNCKECELQNKIIFEDNNSNDNFIRRRQMNVSITKTEMIKQIIDVCNEKSIKYHKKHCDIDGSVYIQISYGEKDFAIFTGKRFNYTEDINRIFEDKGTICIWLRISNRYYDRICRRPEFDIEFNGDIVNVRISKHQRLSLRDFIPLMLSNNIILAESFRLNTIGIAFEKISCWNCGYDHTVYFIKRYYDSFGIEHTPESDEGLSFNPQMITKIKEYIIEHPELDLQMGDIKERYSKTASKSYLSFGCPKCDAIVGEFYLHNLGIDVFCDENDDYLHTLNVQDMNLELPCLEWLVEE